MAACFRLVFWTALSLTAYGCEKPQLTPIGARIDGPYVLAADILGAAPGKLICYQKLDDGCEKRVPAPVVKLGWDEDFVSAAVGKIGDPDALQYYYIVRDFDGPRAGADRAVRGPYDEGAFIEERRKHGVPGVAPIGAASN